MAHPDLFDVELFFQSKSRQKLWPRRLLHVAGNTLTSVEREGDYTYLGIDKPGYNILSYTWGRFTNDSGPSLHIENVDWDIPSIEPEVFTVEEFRQVINTVSKGMEFIWIDIACIDQKNYKMKMEEIGRQAGIFLNAKQPFIWLHGSSISPLQDYFGQLDDMALQLTDNRLTFDTATDESEETTLSVPNCITDAKWIEDAKATMLAILGDKWFSSLWTLQEACLRPNARFISKDAQLVRGYRYRTLARTLHNLERIFTRYTSYHLMDDTLKQAMPLLKELESAMQQNRQPNPDDNPFTWYGYARSRECIEPVDRIYGIMQIFGFRLGATSDSNLKHSYTLEDLEYQFAVELNAISLVMSQLFVHTKPEALGSCWRISQHSIHAPILMRWMNSISKAVSTIQMNERQQAIFSGPACDFDEIARIWKDAARWSMIDGERREKFAMHIIGLDENEYWSSRISEDMRNIQSWKFEVNRELLDMIIRQCGGDIRVLLLGRFGTSEFLLETDSPETPELPGSMGMLARRVRVQGNEIWQRLGVCMWVVDAEDANREEDFSRPWESVSYVLG
jgi:hypothetical protein